MKRRVYLLTAFVIGSILFGGSIVKAQGPRPGGPKAPATALGTGFTYQGQLKQSGALVNALCDFQFGLWDTVSGGAQVSGTTTQTITTTVSGGLFTVQLDFGGNAFNGDARYLAITSRCPAGSAGFTNLTPRESISPAPYALTAMKTAYKNVLVVAKSGGHYNTINLALSSISDNSTTNRYLIWVAPGTYTETVTMKQYVDIEGAGEVATKITQAGSALENTGTVVGANNAELRFLTAENTGGNAYAIAIYNSSASPRLTHVTATGTGGSSTTYGVYNAISSSPRMTNVTAIASGGTSNYGVANLTSSPTMANVTATASGGTENVGVYHTTSSFSTMTNVTATASGGINSYGVYNNDSSSPTMTNVTASGSGGSDNNFGIYNSTSSPTMTNVNATASGGAATNYGVYNISSSPTMLIVTATANGGGISTNNGVSNNGSSPTMTNVIATASGGTISHGVYNSNSAAPMMTNVTATASGGTTSRGVNNSDSSPTIQNSTVTGSGGTNNYGIFNNASSGTYTVTVNNSQVKGSTNTVRNDAEFTTFVGASKLDGGAVFVNGGVVTCAGVYDEAYVFSASTCP